MVIESHLRSDAQRNLERILDAAHAVFAERGVDASVADVAARAGVGTATIFRRFPTKEDLLVAVVESELNGLLAQVEASTSLEELMTVLLERYIGARCLCDVAGSALFENPALAAVKARNVETMTKMLWREQAAGTVRADVTPQDIEFLVNAIGQAGIRSEKTSPGAWRRYVGVVLAGLRP